MARVLVTGASGFIGRHLVPLLAARGHEVVEAGRRAREAGSRFVNVGGIDGGTRWEAALTGMEAVIHLAGLAHHEAALEADYFRVNAEGTRRLIEACEAAGIGAMVLVSSIAARDGASAYGASKRMGESHVRRFAEERRRAGIVLRPPLVYGHDAPGNWGRLQRLAHTGLPLPFGRTANRRTLCSVGNLCDALATAVEAALRGIGSGVYEVADQEAVSLRDILVFLRTGMGIPARLLPVPPSLLRPAARVLGGQKMVAALLDDLTLDASDFIRTFKWKPPETASNAITQSGRLYALNFGGIKKPASAAS